MLIKAVNQEWDYFLFFLLFFSLWICLCHSDQSCDDKRNPFLQVNNRILRVCLMQDSLMQTFGVFKVLGFYFFFLGLLLYFHLLFMSFLSVGSATSKNIWVHYTGLVAQRNIVFFTLKHLRRRKLPVIHETIPPSHPKFPHIQI